MKFRFLIAFASLWISTSACADDPVNLIPNGDFASSIDDWTCDGPCFWTDQGSMSTGAIDIPGMGASTITSSCFSILPQTVYDVSFDAWANIGLAGGEFDLFCYAYGTTNCEQPTGNFSYLPLYYFGKGSWDSTQGQHDTQANEFSAMCEVHFSANGAEMRMDNFVFTFNHQLDDIYADGFDGSP